MRVFLPTDVSRLVGSNAKDVRNRSLAADKYAWFTDNLNDKDDHADAKQESVSRLCDKNVFDEGPASAARRELHLGLTGATVFRAALGGRLIINQAGGVIENAGLALDRNSGVPFIPGSAVKGIARVGAALSETAPAEIALVFGWTASKVKDLPAKSFAGSVAFLPAYPTSSAAIEMDIVNSHHAEYYSRKKDPDGCVLHPLATDDEKPVPNFFPVVRAGTEFQFILLPAGAGRTNAVKTALGLDGMFDPLAKAREWLLAGLTQHGIGAKTAAGYGWFNYDEAAEKAREAADAAKRRADAEAQRRAAMSEEERYAEDLAKLDLLKEFASIDKLPEPQQRLLLKAIRARGAEAVLNKQKNEKGQKRITRFKDLCARLGIT